MDGGDWQTENVADTPLKAAMPATSIVRKLTRSGHRHIALRVIGDKRRNAGRHIHDELQDCICELRRGPTS